LPNWINAQAIVPMDRMNPLRAEWGIPEDRFVVLYAGTFGRVHGTAQLIDAAQQLRMDGQVTFLLVGQGHDFEHVKKLAESRGLRNVMVKEFVPRARLGELQAIADVSIVTLRSGLGNISVPSKVLGYMAAGRPVIGLVDSSSDTASLLRNAKCGVVLEPGDIVGLARELRALAANRSLAREWGQRGRQHVLDQLDAQVVLGRGVEMLETVARGQAVFQ
jgi:colanic acid biosynthesis glycosyl transferase WcaI